MDAMLALSAGESLHQVKAAAEMQHEGPQRDENRRCLKKV